MGDASNNFSKDSNNLNIKNRISFRIEHKKEYKTWVDMRQRCLNPNSPRYYSCGGRGISICDRWMESFENFLEDVGKRPDDMKFLRRVDLDGNYCKENCKWMAVYPVKTKTVNGGGYIERISAIGEKYGDLLVLEEVEPTLYRGHPIRMFLCLCTCGNESRINLCELRRSRYPKKRCSKCIHEKTKKELRKLRKLKIRTRLETRYIYTDGGISTRKPTPEYTAWIMMKARCYNKRVTGFNNYGGRGIRVCDRWLESFENFLEDMGKKSDGMSLDRIDVDGNYCKENCRWATQKEQMNNTRSNRWYKAKKKTVPEK